MKKSAKWSLGIIIFFIVLIIFISILPKSEKQKAEAGIKVPAESVALNYGEHAIITHQQIIDTIKKNVNEELKLEELDWRLKKVEIKDKKIRVFLDLQFRPQSKNWVVKEGKSWLLGIASQGLYDNNDELIGNVYSTGCDISVLLWTWFEEDGSEVLPYGHATIFNSGKPFTIQSVQSELKWMDGAGMKMLK